jgi:glutamate--cysteine ligase
MYFVLRHGRYHDCTHVTFRQFMNGALKDSIPESTPNMGDWTNHLSTLFPEVRLKRFLEMRGADGGPWRRICALPAFWVGLLYDEEALDAAEAMTSDWTYPEVQALRDEVPAKGLSATLRNRSVHEIARDALAISRLGLKNRAKLNSEGFDETHYLSSLEEVVARGTTSAEQMLSQYNSAWGSSVEPAFLEYAY